MFFARNTAGGSKLRERTHYHSSPSREIHSADLPRDSRRSAYATWRPAIEIGVWCLFHGFALRAAGLAIRSRFTAAVGMCAFLSGLVSHLPSPSTRLKPLSCQISHQIPPLRRIRAEGLRDEYRGKGWFSIGCFLYAAPGEAQQAARPQELGHPHREPLTWLGKILTTAPGRDPQVSKLLIKP